MTGQASNARVIVIGNEKGGAGKSTIAIHIACALMHSGSKVAALDLDLRQQSMGKFFANRKAWTAANEKELPMPVASALSDDTAALAARDPGEALARFDEALAKAREEADIVLIDTPGADSELSRTAHARADLVVTPINDSFVDFDMLGLVDPVSLELIKPSLYSEAVWEARKRKMMQERQSLDWLVLRTRLATVEARNRKRLDERLQALSRRVGFRLGPGLRERVIYRELFPFGLTIADVSSKVKPVTISLSHITARQELRALINALGLKGQPAAAGGGETRETAAA